MLVDLAIAAGVESTLPAKHAPSAIMLERISSLFYLLLYLLFYIFSQTVKLAAHYILADADLSMYRFL